MGYQTMTVQQLEDTKAFFEKCRLSALKRGNSILMWRALNQLRVINAEIEVAKVKALAENRTALPVNCAAARSHCYRLSQRCEWSRLRSRSRSIIPGNRIHVNGCIGRRHLLPHKRRVRERERLAHTGCNRHEQCKCDPHCCETFITFVTIDGRISKLKSPASEKPTPAS